MAALPTTMTAIGIKAAGGPDMLVPEQRPLPVPGTGEVLVKVAAAGIFGASSPSRNRRVAAKAVEQPKLASNKRRACTKAKQRGQW